jgi:hypothetical protein
LIHHSEDPVPVKSLRVVHESRPYELGLLLCSFAKYQMAES